MWIWSEHVNLMGKNLKKWSCFLNIFLGIFVLIVWKHQMIGEIFDQPTKCSFPPVSDSCSNAGSTHVLGSASDEKKFGMREERSNRRTGLCDFGTLNLLVDLGFNLQTNCPFRWFESLSHCVYTAAILNKTSADRKQLRIIYFTYNSCQIPLITAFHNSLDHIC